MFSVYNKNKGIGLTVPILLEGTVNIRYDLLVSLVEQNLFSGMTHSLFTSLWLDQCAQ